MKKIFESFNTFNNTVNENTNFDLGWFDNNFEEKLTTIAAADKLIQDSDIPKPLKNKLDFTMVFTPKQIKEMKGVLQNLNYTLNTIHPLTSEPNFSSLENELKNNYKYNIVPEFKKAQVIVSNVVTDVINKLIEFNINIITLDIIDIETSTIDYKGKLTKKQAEELVDIITADRPLLGVQIDSDYIEFGINVKNKITIK
jgi:hypothetical protein